MITTYKDAETYVANHLGYTSPDTVVGVLAGRVLELARRHDPNADTRLDEELDAEDWDALIEAAGQLADLIADSVTYDGPERHVYTDGTVILEQTVYDDDSDEAGCSETAVAWAGPEGSGACFVDTVDLATWLSLRWPATTGHGGYLRDGSWIDEPARFGR